MATTAWTNNGGDNLASNNENWASGLPDRWNTPYFDLTSRVEITWDLRSFSPDEYEWKGDIHNLFVTYSLVVFVGGTPWVPSWLVALVQQNGVSARIDGTTLPAPPGEEYTLRTTGEKFIIEGNPLDALGYSSLDWVVFGHDILPLPKGGANRTWSAAADGIWNAAANWDGGATVPALGDNIIFNATSVKNCTVDVVAGAFGTLTISANTSVITVNTAFSVTTTSITSNATITATTANVTFGALTINSATAVVKASAGITITIGGITTITAGTLGVAATNYALDMNGNLATSTGTLIAPNATGTFNFSGATFNTPTTYTNSSGTVTFDLAGTSTLGNNSTAFYAVTVNDGATLASSTFNYTAANNMVVGAGATGVFTTSTGTKIITGTLTLNAGASFGTAAIVYTLTLTGGLTGTNGTLIAPNATGVFNYAAATWYTPTVFTHSSGIVTFTRVGTTTLGNNSTAFNRVVVSTGGVTLDTSAANNYTFTTASMLTVSAAANFIANNSAISLASGLVDAALYGLTTTGANAWFQGGTGAHTIASIINNTTCKCTLTSGLTTINGRGGGSYAIINSATATLFAHNSGSIDFTYAAAASTLTLGAAAARLNNVTVSTAAAGVLSSNTAGSVFDGWLTVNRTGLGGFSTITGAHVITGLVTITNGIFTVAIATQLVAGITINAGVWITTAAANCDGPFLLNAGEYRCATNIASTFATTWTSIAGSTVNLTTGTLTFDGGGARVVTNGATLGGTSLGNFVTCSTSGATTAVTQGSRIHMIGGLTTGTGTTWNTGADYRFYSAGYVGNTGGMTCNASEIVINGYCNLVGVWNGGSGTHYIQAMRSQAAAGLTMTSGTCYMLFSYALTLPQTFYPNTNWSHGNGTINFCGYSTVTIATPTVRTEVASMYQGIQLEDFSNSPFWNVIIGGKNNYVAPNNFGPGGRNFIVNGTLTVQNAVYSIANAGYYAATTFTAANIVLNNYGTLLIDAANVVSCTNSVTINSGGVMSTSSAAPGLRFATGGTLTINAGGFFSGGVYCNGVTTITDNNVASRRCTFTALSVGAAGVLNYAMKLDAISFTATAAQWPNQPPPGGYYGRPDAVCNAVTVVGAGLLNTTKFVARPREHRYV